MALIHCPECGGNVSTSAATCPHCGFPIAESTEANKQYYKVKIVVADRSSLNKLVTELQRITGVAWDVRSGAIIVRGAYEMEQCNEITEKLSFLSHSSNEIRVYPIDPKEKGIPEESSAKCPYCGSSQIQAVKKGFGLGKATAGLLIAGPVGLAAGAIGSNNIQRVCLSCGKKF